MSNPRWQGIFPAVTTKFHADERIDAEGTARHIDFQIRNGIHGLVTCGSLGEASTLSLEEKLQVARIALEAADELHTPLVGVSLVHQLFAAVERAHGADVGTQALVRAIETLAGAEVGGANDE